MTKLQRMGEYLTAGDVKEGDVLIIVGEPQFRDKEETGFSRDTYSIKVVLPNGAEKTWTLNKTTYNALFDAYGDEGQNWVNREVRITTERRKVRGRDMTVLYGDPVMEPGQRPLGVGAQPIDMELKSRIKSMTPAEKRP